MSRYLSMVKTEIREFVSTQLYQTLTKLQSNARRREIKLEVQRKEDRTTLVQFQLTAKQFKSVESRSGPVEQGSPKYVRCGSFHDGRCRSFACRMYRKEGHLGRDYRQSLWVCFHCDQERSH